MPITTIEVRYPAARGAISLRGSIPPLSWEESLPPTLVTGNLHVFDLELPAGELVELKPVRDGSLWAGGRNYTVLAGDTLRIEPYFEEKVGRLEDGWETLRSPQLDRDVRFRTFLPPSYDEHLEKRYPVLYAQDGRSLFSDAVDPIDGQSWRMDDALNGLWDLGAIEELIVVAVDTSQDRLALLSPTRDAELGGGDGPRYRDFLADTLKPAIDARYRTLATRHDTALIGSSMGGLFSFFAAWTRPAVFGRAACLSSSFWWDGRAMVHEVQKGSCPLPRPWLYLDSGAARDALENDANLRDGYHHTQALRQALVNHCYVPGENIHTLAFTGASHNNGSWAARLALPLQLLFPRRG